MLAKNTMQRSPKLELYDVKFNFETVENEIGRFYKTPNGWYPSVTTKLGQLFKPDLSEWINRVGLAEANKIMTQGKHHGTALHKIVENYLLGKDWQKNTIPVYRESFLKIKPVIDENIKTIYGIEYPLWSPTLETAGQADLLCKFGDHTAIIDFKKSRRKKKKEHILNYFFQTITYGHMANSMLDMGVTHLGIIISVDGERLPQIFFEKITDQMWKTVETKMKSIVITYDH